MPFRFSWIVGQYNVVSFALKFINLKNNEFGFVTQCLFQNHFSIYNFSKYYNVFKIVRYLWTTTLQSYNEHKPQTIG